MVERVCRTASVPKILKAMAKQARRQHVLTLPERMAPTVARKSTSNTNPEFGQVLVASLLQALLNIHERQLWRQRFNLTEH